MFIDERYEYKITRATIDACRGVEPSELGDSEAAAYAKDRGMVIRSRSSRYDEEGNLLVTYFLEVLNPERLAHKVLPNSKEEKATGGGRWMYVHELRSLLEKFLLTDTVTVNEIGNLRVSRPDLEGEFWVINTRENTVEHIQKKKAHKQHDR